MELLLEGETLAVWKLLNGGPIMFREIVLHSRKIIKYSVCLLIFLNVLDIISTYIGIKYVNAYEANEKAAYLFNLFGMLLPSGLKILTVLLLGFITKIIWENSEFMLQNGNGLGNSVAIISILNIMFIVIFLNIVYFLIIVNNINIIYN
ncbi:MAG: DUF5658 family protein [Candidatus Methanoperedens sp.]|nr:DUF5658 family protein [Candidatus Methanoperedens sp.]